MAFFFVPITGNPYYFSIMENHVAQKIYFINFRRWTKTEHVKLSKIKKSLIMHLLFYLVIILAIAIITNIAPEIIDKCFWDILKFFIMFIAIKFPMFIKHMWKNAAKNG